MMIVTPRQRLGSFVMLAALTLTLFAGGCASEPPAATVMPAATRPVQTQPATARPAPPMASVPILYAGYLNPEPLPESEFQTIWAESEEIKPAGREIWFILVLNNRVYDFGKGGERHRDALVYFTPDEESNRVRRGECFFSGTGYRSLQGRKKFMKQMREAWDPARDRQKYMTVSMPGQSFNQAVYETPTTAMLPFTPPEGFSEAEVVELIDSLRSEEEVTPPPGLFFKTKRNQSLPIHEFKREGDSVVIWTGWQVGLLAGAGETIKFVRKDGKWKREGGVGIWHS